MKVDMPLNKETHLNYDYFKNKKILTSALNNPIRVDMPLIQLSYIRTGGCFEAIFFPEKGCIFLYE